MANTYRVVVRDQNWWNQETGIHELLRECGHRHKSETAAGVCLHELLYGHRPRVIEDRGADSLYSCLHRKDAYGRSVHESWSADWHLARIETVVEASSQEVPK